MVSGETEIEAYEHGAFVDLRLPDPSKLCLEDVARGLGYTCRYGGVGVSRFYSVAEHSVLVHDLLKWMGRDQAACLGGLWHDAPEAYLGDLIAPLKYAIRNPTIGPVRDDGACEYDELTVRMEVAIGQAFGVDITHFDTPVLRTADMWALRIEAAALTRSGGSHWRWPGELPNGGGLPDDVHWAGGLPPDEARNAWLEAAR